MTQPWKLGQSAEFKSISVLIAVNFVDMIGFMLILPLLPFYALELNATPSQVGWIIAAFSIAQLLSAPLWGRVSDRYGRRPALLIGLLSAALAYVVFAFADLLWLLFVSRFVQGMGGGTTGVAQAYVADSVKPSERAKALGWLSSATSAGVVVGPLIGSLAVTLGRAAPGLVAASLCVLNAAFMWRWLPESRVVHDGPPAPPRSVWRPAWEVVRHPERPVSQLIWIYGIGMLAFSSLTATLPLFLKEEFYLTAATYGYVLTYVGLLSVILRVVILGPVVARLGERWTMRMGCFALIAGFGLYPVVHNFWLLLVFVVPLVPLGTALLFPSTTSLVSSRADKRELGVTMGVAQTFAGVARVLSPIVATRAFQDLGHGWPFYLAALLVCFVTWLAFRVNGVPEAEAAGA